METVELHDCEVQRWTVVFHRTAANWIFSLIAMGRFKHVSAFAWVPDLRVWIVYDVGFRRSRIVLLPDTEESKARLRAVITGNCIVTLNAMPGGFPLWRFGFFCTSAIKHLLGLRGGALRPDALFRLCVREGGEVSDDAISPGTAGRSDVATAAEEGRAGSD